MFKLPTFMCYSLIFYSGMPIYRQVVRLTIVLVWIASLIVLASTVVYYIYQPCLRLISLASQQAMCFC